MCIYLNPLDPHGSIAERKDSTWLQDSSTSWFQLTIMISKRYLNVLDACCTYSLLTHSWVGCHVFTRGLSRGIWPSPRHHVLAIAVPPAVFTFLRSHWVWAHHVNHQHYKAVTGIMDCCWCHAGPGWEWQHVSFVRHNAQLECHHHHQAKDNHIINKFWFFHTTFFLVLIFWVQDREVNWKL